VEDRLDEFESEESDFGGSAGFAAGNATAGGGEGEEEVEVVDARAILRYVGGGATGLGFLPPSLVPTSRSHDAAIGSSACGRGEGGETLTSISVSSCAHSDESEETDGSDGGGRDFWRLSADRRTSISLSVSLSLVSASTTTFGTGGGTSFIPE
jgi:hypothetical protein